MPPLLLMLADHARPVCILALSLKYKKDDHFAGDLFRNSFAKGQLNVKVMISVWNEKKRKEEKMDSQIINCHVDPFGQCGLFKGLLKQNLYEINFLYSKHYYFYVWSLLKTRRQSLTIF